MSLQGGDPRTAAPELVRTLTGWERSLADLAFRRRLSYAGLNDPEFPDDEAPASVAAWCVRSAATRAATLTSLAGLVALFTAIVATNEVHEIPQPYSAVMGIVLLAVIPVVALLRTIRALQMRRFLAQQRPTGPAGPPLEFRPVPGGPRIGPDELAPVLMANIGRFERSVVRSFFPGGGAISTGVPSWDGSPRDRIILRRALRFDAWLVLLVFYGLCGSLLIDVAFSVTLSWLNPDFDNENGAVGIFLLGWIGAVVWFVRRRLAIRRWYRAGLGRESELARNASTPSVYTTDSPGTGVHAPSDRARLVLAGVSSLFLTGLAVWMLVGALDVRASSLPVPGGVTTTGKVVDVEVHDESYEAAVEFSDRDGSRFVIRSVRGQDRPEIGTAVTVSYDPDRPELGHDITTNHDTWKWPFGTALIAGFVALVSAAIPVVQVRRGKLRW